MDEKLLDSRYLLSVPNAALVKPVLPSGMLAGQEMTKLLCRLTIPVHDIEKFCDYPIPFACVATNLKTGEAYTLAEGFLPEALRASMGMPAIFTPVELGDLLLFDGAHSRNLPIADVIRLGANMVIAVDVGSPLHRDERLESVNEVLYQATRFHAVNSYQSNMDSSKVGMLIKPEVQRFKLSSFDHTAELIQRGFEAANKDSRFNLFNQLPNRSRNGQAVRMPALSDTYNVVEIEVQGLDKIPLPLVLAGSSLRVPQKITLAKLEDAVDRVYNLRLFERVGYQLKAKGADKKLAIRVVEKKSPNWFRMGARYDSEEQGAFLLNTTFHNLFRFRSTLICDIRLGQLTQAAEKFYGYIGKIPNFGISLKADFTRSFLYTFQEQEREAGYQIHTKKLDAFFGTIYSTKLVAGFGARLERTQLRRYVGVDPYKDYNQNLIVPFGLLQFDTVDRTIFPRSGRSIILTGEAIQNIFPSSNRFGRYHFSWKEFIPLGARKSFLAKVQIGGLSSSNAPLHYQLFLGGADSFLGLRSNSRRCAQVLTALLGLQWEPFQNMFIIPQTNAAKTRQDLSGKADDVFGGGITFGYQNSFVPLPIEFTAASTGDRRVQYYLNIGFRF